jgi:hypothetical protein
MVLANEGMRVQLLRNTETNVRFPSEMPVTKAGFRAPSWQAGTTLQEYCSAVQQCIAAPWQQRRALVQALAAACGMLEYDAADFSSAHIFVQVRSDTVVISD